jgi:hypothetical protein
MKSVVEVAFSGSWFCNSLSRRLRKSLDEIVEDELDDEDVEDVALDVEETVMARSGGSARAIGEGRSARWQAFASRSSFVR